MNKITVILLEPAPYHFDLWNEFVSHSEYNSLKVIFTESRDRLPDSGHDFRSFPKQDFNALFLDNSSLSSSLHLIYVLTREILFSNSSCYFLATYHKFQTFYALLLLSAFRKKYLFFIDRPSILPSRSFLHRLKRFPSYLARRIVASSAHSILACGLCGVNDSRVAFSPHRRIYNFPYVVSKSRIQADALSVNYSFASSSKRRIIFFSGRMISRKGLSSLLEACSLLPFDNSWLLLVEGDGPLLSSLKNIALRLGLSDYVHFVGFSQHRRHSYFLTISDIVVVPSFQDNWGIVVDEALQLNKVVLASQLVGSAVDLIVDNENGYLFDPRSSRDIYRILSRLISLDDEHFSSCLSLRFEPSKYTPFLNCSLLKELCFP